MPTQTMSSQTEVPSTYLANGREDHPISSSTFASSVVAESQIATPRKSDAAGVQPKTRVPAMYPSQIITAVSSTAAGSATTRMRRMSRAENDSPIANMRKTTPS